MSLCACHIFPQSSYKVLLEASTSNITTVNAFYYFSNTTSWNCDFMKNVIYLLVETFALKLDYVKLFSTRMGSCLYHNRSFQIALTYYRCLLEGIYKSKYYQLKKILRSYNRHKVVMILEMLPFNSFSRIAWRIKFRPSITLS